MGRFRGWVTWRRSLAALALIAVVVLLAPTPVVDVVVTRVVGGFGSECVALTGVDVHSGSWPVVARALTGGLRDVDVEVDEIRFDAFTVHDARFTVDSASVDPLGAALLARDADVDGGEASGTVRFDELERIIAANGVDLTLRRDGERVMADVQVPLLTPVPTAVTVAPADGRLEIRLAPFDVVTLPPVHITPAAPFRVADVEVLDDGVRVALAFDGQLAAADDRCDTSVDGGAPGP